MTLTFDASDRHNEWYPWGLQISLHIRSHGFSEIGGGGILKLTLVISNLKFSEMGGGYSGVNFGHLKSEVFRNGGWYSGINFGHLKSEVFRNGGGYSGVNFGHLKSEVFQNGGGGAFWSAIPERGFLENLDKNLLFSQKAACASQIVSHILRMWRLKIQCQFYPGTFLGHLT